MTIPDPLKCGQKTFERWCQREHARGCRFFLDLPKPIDTPGPSWREVDPGGFAFTYRQALDLTHFFDFRACVLEPTQPKAGD